MSDAEKLLAELERVGKRHGWRPARQTLGYYRLRFTRDDGTVAVRIGNSGRIDQVAVNVDGQRYQLTAPTRAAVEEILLQPLPEPTPPPGEPDHRYPRDYSDRQLLEAIWRRIDGLALMLADGGHR